MTLLESLEAKVSAAQKLLRVLGDEGQCKSCNAPIVWVKTKTGKAMPVSLTNLCSHFADCANAAAHRR